MSFVPLKEKRARLARNAVSHIVPARRCLLSSRVEASGYRASVSVTGEAVDESTGEIIEQYWCEDSSDVSRIYEGGPLI
jgi:hypothetical protein